MRRLFGDFADLRCNAEAAGDAAALEVLDGDELKIRDKLRLPRQKQSLPARISMYLRFCLAVIVASWGCICMFLFVPLRLLHPFLRSCGVRNGLLPLDVCTMCWGRAVLAAAFVKVQLPGDLGWLPDRDRAGIIVYNHCSNLDPFIVNAVCWLRSPKYVGKKVLFMLPLLGWLFTLTGMVPINRGNRERAVATMNEAVSGIMKRWKRCVAISPEGTRSTDGHLRLPFKKGVFHLQQQTGVPLLPVIVTGAFDLWPPGQLFTAAGEVIVEVLPVQPFEPATASSDGVLGPRDAVRVKLQRDFAQHISKDPRRAASPLSTAGLIQNLCILLVTSVVFVLCWHAYRWLIVASGLGMFGLMSLLVVSTVTMAFVVERFL